MLSHNFNIFKRFRNPGDLLRVYRKAFERASGNKNPDVKIDAFSEVVNYCDSSQACRIDDSIKRNMVMFWTYNNLGDAWVAKTYQNPTEKNINFSQALDCYREAVRAARDNAEKINSLQRIASIYRHIEDHENLAKTREQIVEALSDEYKRLGYMRLVQTGADSTKNTEWLEQALNYVTKEEVSFLNKCQNTLTICDQLAKNYRKLGDKVNLKRVNRLLNKTAVITVRAIEDKIAAEENREKQLEWYGLMLETVLHYCCGDRKFRLGALRKIAFGLQVSETISADGTSYTPEMLKAMLSIH